MKTNSEANGAVLAIAIILLAGTSLRGDDTNTFGEPTIAQRIKTIEVVAGNASAGFDEAQHVADLSKQIEQLLGQNTVAATNQTPPRVTGPDKRGLERANDAASPNVGPRSLPEHTPLPAANFGSPAASTNATPETWVPVPRSFWTRVSDVLTSVGRLRVHLESDLLPIKVNGGDAK